jgi:hypothetical protein
MVAHFSFPGNWVANRILPVSGQGKESNCLARAGGMGDFNLDRYLAFYNAPPFRVGSGSTSQPKAHSKLIG